MRKASLILIFYFISCHHLFSQQLPLTVYANNYGPIQNGARKIFQDSSGWMWFITGSSVIRYNGQRFLTIVPAAADTMKYCYGIKILDNRLCLIADPYTMIVDGDSLRRHPYLPRNADITAVLLFKGKHYFSGEGGLYLFEDRRIKKIISHSKRGDNRNDIFRFNDSLLVGNFFREGVFVFNMNRNTAHYYTCKSGKIQQDIKGNTYIHLLDKGIVQITGINLSGSNCTITEKLIHPLSVKEAGYFIFDDNENIWAFSSFNWLKKISPSGEQNTYTEADGFPGFVFLDIFKDRENNIWLSHPDGVSKIGRPGISRYTISEGLMANHIAEFFSVPGSSYIIASTKQGSSVFNGNMWKPLQHNDGPFIFYKIIFSKGKQYCLQDNILSEVIIDYAAARVNGLKKMVTIPATPLEAGSDNAGTIYITTQRGVYRYAQNKLSIFDSAKLGRALLVDSHNRLWIGGWFDELTGYNITYNNNSPSFKKIHFAKNIEPRIIGLNAIRGICEADDGNLLAGTASNGLFHLTIRNDSVVQVEQFTVKNGLLSNTVRRIDKDSSGKWWFVTDNGVNSVSGPAGNRLIKDEGSVYGITRVNTLLVNGAAVWISNYPGAVLLSNKKSAVPFPFSVSITSAAINNKSSAEFATGVFKKLSHRQDNLQFSFSANSFINETAILYTYQLLHNGDTSWSPPAAEHSVNFFALRPGHYTFRVKAVNPSGVWSSNIAETKFRIMAPFWIRGWFMGLLALLALTVLYTIYRIRIGQLKKMESVRNEISRNLHDDIGSSLTNISILNELAQRNMQDNEKVSGYISKSGEVIQRINESLADIVWNINPEYDSMEKMLARMKWYAAEMMDGKNINATISFPENGHDLVMPMEQRRDFYLVFKELVNNLTKHSNATEATITIKIANREITMQVKDNGTGIDKQSVKNGNGLESMKQRTARWNAVLDCKTQPGQGTDCLLVMKF